MRFNPDHSIFKFTTTAVQFIFLNFLYIILCLPVVTIGWATSALYAVMLRYADDERGYLVNGFFSALKESWVRPTALAFLIGMPSLLLLASSVFWFSLGTILATIVGLVAILIACHLLVVLNYALALLARYDNGLKQTLKNAFLLPIAQPVYSLGLMVIVIATLTFIVLFPAFRIFFILLGFTFSVYCSSFLILAVFKRHK